jgi:tetratricopeptide (TPR) repeat protein
MLCHAARINERDASVIAVKSVLCWGGALLAAFVVVAVGLNRGAQRSSSAGTMKGSGGATSQSAAKLEAAFERATRLQNEGKLAEAIAGYRALLERRPDHVQAHFNLGVALMNSDNCKLAIPEFERVLELDGSQALAHLHLAHCARLEGHYTAARAHQKRWERKKP